MGARVSTGKCTTGTAVYYISLNTVAPALFKYVKSNPLQTHSHSHAWTATEKNDEFYFFQKPGEFLENLGACVSTAECTTAVYYMSLNTIAPALFKDAKYNPLQAHSLA